MIDGGKFLNCALCGCVEAIYDFLDEGKGGWVGGNSGTGSSIYSVAKSGSYGTVCLSTGTTDSGWARHNEGGYSDEWVGLFGQYVAEFRFGAMEDLNDGSDQYSVICGIVELASPPSSIDEGIFFRYDPSSTKWQAVTLAAGSETATDTGVTVSADQFYWGKIEISPDGSTVDFYLGTTRANAVLVASHTTNISTDELGPMLGIEKSLGTNVRKVHIDLWYHSLCLTTPR